MGKEYHYQGIELELFQKATYWKKYYYNKIKPVIHGNVLEVGAGLGATSKTLNDGSAHKWTLLEPDNKMYDYLIENQHTYNQNTIIKHGTIKDLGNELYDVILYIDVIEHIENDLLELSDAAKRLNKNGRLVILSPAFNFLFSDFDQAIGHYRRYCKSELMKVIPSGMNLITLHYLDTAGFFASLMNKLFLHQSYPTEKQIAFWDNHLVAVSKITDKLFFHSFGKSILGIWVKS